MTAPADAPSRQRVGRPERRRINASQADRPFRRRSCGLVPCGRVVPGAESGRRIGQCCRGSRCYDGGTVTGVTSQIPRQNALLPGDPTTLAGANLHGVTSASAFVCARCSACPWHIGQLRRNGRHGEQGRVRCHNRMEPGSSNSTASRTMLTATTGEIEGRTSHRSSPTGSPP
jgi:hypothetical protein